MRHVQYEVIDHIALVTLDRPDQLNAFTDQMEAALIECFDRSDADDAVRAVVITGAGRAFCAGMDLSEGDGGSPFDRWRTSADAPESTTYDVPGHPLPFRRDGGGRVVLRIFDSTKPVIAAINGHAVGVGITMTLPADIRIAAEGAKIAFPFTQRAFVPESCSSWFLPRVVGVSTALEWMISGRTFTSEEALEAGLVRSLHPADRVLDEAMSIARRLTERTSPVSVALARRMLWQMLGADHPMAAHELETAALNERGVSADAHEGVAAFLERREPRFPGRPSADTPDVLPPPPAYRPPNGAVPR